MGDKSGDRGWDDAGLRSWCRVPYAVSSCVREGQLSLSGDTNLKAI